jgi:hypothetical protein
MRIFKKAATSMVAVGLLAFGAVAGAMSNADGGCLTAPSSGTIAGAPLRMAACRGAVGQQWTVPNVAAV